MRKSLLITAALCALSVNANAEVLNQSVGIEIVTPLTIEETQELDLGTLAKFNSSNANFTINADGTTSSTTNALQVGTPQIGIVNVNSYGAGTLQITMQDDGGDAGLSITQMTGIYNNGSMFVNTASGLSTGENVELKIGATVVVDGSVSSGQLTRNYTTEVVFN